jgi:hypothetical protein
MYPNLSTPGIIASGAGVLTPVARRRRECLAAVEPPRTEGKVMQLLRLGAIGAMVAVVMLAFAGCVRRPQPATASVAALLKESQSGPHVAMDYDKPGHPNLTESERATIRYTLRAVEACQRPLVRYAFGGDTGILMFFSGGGPYSISHIFGQGNLWYSAESENAMVAPPDFRDLNGYESMAEGVQYDVQRESCAGSILSGSQFKVYTATDVERKLQALQLLSRWHPY